MNLNRIVKKLLKPLKSLNAKKMLKTLKTSPLAIILILALSYFLFTRLSGCGCGKLEGFQSQPSTFESDVSQGKKLVWFYADWCGHCKSMKSEWDKASSKVDGKMVKVDLGDNEDSKTNEISKKYNIQGFPTILLLDNGEIVEKYEGERKASDFEKFVNEKCG